MRTQSIFEFSTYSGSRYLYDGNTSMVLPVDDKIMRCIHLCTDKNANDEDILRILEKEFPNAQDAKKALKYVRKMEQNGAFYRDETYEKDVRKFQYDFGNDSLNLLVDNNLFQLLLTVTEDCNLRCRYCYLSDVYDYTRNRTEAQMTFETAKEAIDMFLDKILYVSRRNPGKKAAITFYGGEPLMNFPVIQQCVDYVKQKSTVEILFNITTNGVLLEGEVLEYLIENDFVVTVSFDGAKKNHDRNRIFPDCNGSYEHIFKCLKDVKQKYPDYKKIKIITVIDYETDLIANADFFMEHKDKLPDLVMINFVTPTNTRYFDGISTEIVNAYNVQYDAILREYIESFGKGVDISPFIRMLIEPSLFLVLNRARMNDVRPPMLPFTGTCVPGMKISVRVDGTFDMCERINQMFPIGNTTQGLSFSNIAEVIKKYNKNVTEKCHLCPINKVCPLCFAQCSEGDCFKVTDNTCNGVILGFLRNVSILYSIGERNPDALQRFVDVFEEPIEWLLNN